MNGLPLTFQWHWFAVHVHHVSIRRLATVDNVAQIQALLAAPLQARLTVVIDFQLFSRNVPQPHVNRIRLRRWENRRGTL